MGAKMRNEYDQQLSFARQNSKLANNAYTHIYDRTEAMRIDQLEIAQKLGEDYENLTLDASGAQLQAQLRNFVYQEREYFKLFDISKSMLALPYQVSFNKMNFILSKVYNEIISDTDATSFIRLAQGKLEADETFDHFPVLRTKTYWGSNQGTIENAKLLCMRFAFSEESILDYAESSIAHVTPCINLTLPIVKNTNSKFFVPIDGTAGFGFVHGGYAFGGQRGENIKYKFGPEDCSSMVENLLEQTINQSEYTAAKKQFSTLDLLNAWYGNKNLHNLQSVRQDHVTAGDIFLLRTATSGHTGIVIDRDPDDKSKVLIFECARDMEIGLGNAGAGVGSFSAKQAMFLRKII